MPNKDPKARSNKKTSPDNLVARILGPLAMLQPTRQYFLTPAEQVLRHVARPPAPATATTKPEPKREIIKVEPPCDYFLAVQLKVLTAGEAVRGVACRPYEFEIAAVRAAVTKSTENMASGASRVLSALPMDAPEHEQVLRFLLQRREVAPDSSLQQPPTKAPADSPADWFAVRLQSRGHGEASPGVCGVVAARPAEEATGAPQVESAALTALVVPTGWLQHTLKNMRTEAEYLLFKVEG